MLFLWYHEFLASHVELSLRLLLDLLHLLLRLVCEAGCQGFCFLHARQSLLGLRVLVGYHWLPWNSLGRLCWFFLLLGTRLLCRFSAWFAALLHLCLFDGGWLRSRQRRLFFGNLCLILVCWLWLLGGWFFGSLGLVHLLHEQVHGFGSCHLFDRLHLLLFLFNRFFLLNDLRLWSNNFNLGLRFNDFNLLWLHFILLGLHLFISCLPLFFVLLVRCFHRPFRNNLTLSFFDVLNGERQVYSELDPLFFYNLCLYHPS